MSWTNGVKVWRFTGLTLTVWFTMSLQVRCEQKLYTYKEYGTNEDQQLYKYKEYGTNKVEAQNVGSTPKSGLQVIYPGTKWCGDGDVASDYDDLGVKRETDACCRQHDMCDDIIEAGASKHGLTNDAKYTKLHCDCDDILHKCLTNVANTTKEDTLVGFIYFDAIGSQCYRKDYPITGCRRRSEWKTRCLEYILDRSAPKTWQWYDAPFF